MQRVETIIIGGGITGAALLHRLCLRGEDVLLLEAADRIGGVVRSRRTPAGVLEECGPNSTMLGGGELEELIDELGLADEVVCADPRARNRYVVRKGRLVPTPLGPASFLLSHLLSFAGKIRLLREPFVPARTGDEDESVASFISRRLGRDVLDYGIDPFVSGVYAGKVEDLSVESAFARLRSLEHDHGSLARGMVARMRAARKSHTTGKRAGGMISFREGMEALPRRIQERWGDRIRVKSAVTSLVRTEDGWIVLTAHESFIASRVVIATPATVAARMLGTFNERLGLELRSIPYAPVASVTSLYRREDITHPLDGFGCLVPTIEHRRILGIVFLSTLFSGRVPEGMVAVRTLIGGARNRSAAYLSDIELESLCYDEHRELLGAMARPVETSIYRWSAAIPQYNIGHRSILASVEVAEHCTPGLFFAGNYRDGISVGDCVRHAFELAAKLGAPQANATGDRSQSDVATDTESATDAADDSAEIVTTHEGGQASDVAAGGIPNDRHVGMDTEVAL